MQDNFTISLPCKKYVKAYLESNCGDPVNLQLLPDLLSGFRRALTKKTCHRPADPPYKDTVTIIIPTDWFYRYGWEINNEQVFEFNRIVEDRCKFMMRQYISVNNALGAPVAKCIRDFQENLGFPEHIWSYEAIKKDFFRNGKSVDMKTIKDLKIEINKILLDNLSDLGTVSRNFKKENIYG